MSCRTVIVEFGPESARSFVADVASASLVRRGGVASMQVSVLLVVPSYRRSATAWQPAQLAI
jgi:hypothetical protein